MTMKNTTEGEREFFFFKWFISEELKDPDFADDTCLLSHNFVKMEKKLMEFAKCRNNCQITEKL
jgi:hypothetical protein